MFSGSHKKEQMTGKVWSVCVQFSADTLVTVGDEFYTRNCHDNICSVYW